MINGIRPEHYISTLWSWSAAVSQHLDRTCPTWRRGVTEDAISIGGVDLADPSTYESCMPHEAFSELRRRAPVALHPYQDGPGFLALTGYDEVQAVSRDSATWSSQAKGVMFHVRPPTK